MPSEELKATILELFEAHDRKWKSGTNTGLSTVDLHVTEVARRVGRNLNTVRVAVYVLHNEGKLERTGRSMYRLKERENERAAQEHLHRPVEGGAGQAPADAARPSGP